MALQLRSLQAESTGRMRLAARGLAAPGDAVVAVIDDERDALRAVAELASAGVPLTDIEMLDGPEAARLDETFRRRRAALVQLAALVATLMEADERQREEYAAEAQRGHRTVVVHAPEPRMLQGVRAALADHRAHHARYYRSVVAEDLS